MEALQQLREAQTQFRYYEVHNCLLDKVETALTTFGLVYPEDDWSLSRYVQEISPPSDQHGGIYGTKPIIKWGTADTSVFKQKWGIVLPDWMEEFYRHVTCGLLPMLNQIRILSPEEAVAEEDERRMASEELHLPYRLIRLAEGASDGSGFSLRQRLCDDQWEIIVTSGSFSVESYQSEEWEGDAGKDKNINDWLLRMLQTDGHPLMIDNSYEPMGSKRLK